MNLSRDLTQYYAQRAEEYDRVCCKPERQQDNAALRSLFQEMLAGHDVLEVACGTGFWTIPIAEVAHSIVATDVNEEVLHVAQSKPHPKDKIHWFQADAYTLDGVDGNFSAAFVASWFSHIPKSRRLEFLYTLHSKLQPGALVVLVDNTYVHGSNNPQAEFVDDEGNTYSCRQLEDGTQWEIIKNFPTEEELCGLLGEQAEDVDYRQFDYYWVLRYRIQR